MNNTPARSDLIGEYNSLADAICARVGKRDIANWCFSLEIYLNLPARTLLTQHIKKEHIVRVNKFGVNLTFIHPHAIYDNKGDISRWFLHCAEFTFSPKNSMWHDIPPFSLDVTNETQDTIIKKLGDNFTDIRESDSIQTFFMNDGRVVGIQWNHSNHGIKKIIVTHLGNESDYEYPK